MWFFNLVSAFFKVYFAIMFRVKIVGLENIPKEGGAVLCCNHFSNYDPVMMGIYIGRLPHFIAKKELFKGGFMNWAMKNLGAFPVDREATMDMKAVKTAVGILKSGELLGIFAEGTRVKEGEAKAAKAGVALFAMKGDAPIIPVAISGNYKFRSTVTVAYGTPMMFEEYRTQKLTTEKMGEITEEVMKKIREMKEKS